MEIGFLMDIHCRNIQFGFFKIYIRRVSLSRYSAPSRRILSWKISLYGERLRPFAMQTGFFQDSFCQSFVSFFKIFPLYSRDGFGDAFRCDSQRLQKLFGIVTVVKFLFEPVNFDAKRRIGKVGRHFGTKAAVDNAVFQRDD